MRRKCLILVYRVLLQKSVALSGVAAGSTALCTVGNTGNDLYYRGYDILEFGIPNEIAFDHDLGGDDTSIVFINWLINEMLDEDLKLPEGFKFSIHSMNPIGVENIKSLMTGVVKEFN
jgi:hypothetical protein